MKFKIKERKEDIIEDEFLIFPRKFDGHYYCLCWATVRYSWIGWRYQRFGEMISEGRQ